MGRLRRWLRQYRLRLRRKRLCLRSYRKGLELRMMIPPGDRGSDRYQPLVFSTVRNERARLPAFLAHYRGLGVTQFFFVENDSDDGTLDYLAQQPDVALWRTRGSYRRSRYGVDWLRALKRRYGTGRWCLTVDADELLIYPNWETRPLTALTAWLEDHGCASFRSLLLDLYPGPEAGAGASGADPLAPIPWFDRGNYRAQTNALYGEEWIQGGPRERAFFADQPRRAPALNKIPLIKWAPGYAYVSSTHNLLPRRLNRPRPTMPTGVLLHTKLGPGFTALAAREARRKEHFGQAYEYRSYLASVTDPEDLWHPGSERYKGWRQLERLGLMSRGNWV